MTFTINSLSLCAGGNHVTISATVNGNARTVRLLRSDFALDPGELDDAAIARLRSAVKEAGATTNAQIQTALVGKTFQV